MAADQQFCLRWNNHQSTLVAVFDTLLENGTLVDCTVAAEGQFMRAHKVVLSACSPYFQLLLSQHYEKHPIIILKDVKFQELKAMMDYMYRGEVNISQDQLGALLKAAESLQIKGLSDSGGGSDKEKEIPEKKPEPRKQPPVLQPRSTPPVSSHSNLSVETRRVPVNHSTPVNHHPSSADLPPESPPVTPKTMSRDECASPTGRKRKKHRRRSSSDDHSDSALHDGLEASSSNELPPQSQPVSLSNLPATITSVPLSSSKLSITATPPIEPKVDPESRPPLKVSRLDVTQSAPPTIPIETVVHKIEPNTEEIIEPKTEFVEENNEDSIEDLTLDDDDELDMDQAQAGPSHGGDDSSQGYAPWHMAADQSRDEVFMAAQEAVGAHRDSQDLKLFVLVDPREQKPDISIIEMAREVNDDGRNYLNLNTPNFTTDTANVSFDRNEECSHMFNKQSLTNIKQDSAQEQIDVKENMIISPNEESNLLELSESSHSVLDTTEEFYNHSLFGDSCDTDPLKFDSDLDEDVQLVYDGNSKPQNISTCDDNKHSGSKRGRKPDRRKRKKLNNKTKVFTTTSATSKLQSTTQASQKLRRYRTRISTGALKKVTLDPDNFASEPIIEPIKKPTPQTEPTTSVQTVPKSVVQFAQCTDNERLVPCPLCHEKFCPALLYDHIQNFQHKQLPFVKKAKKES